MTSSGTHPETVGVTQDIGPWQVRATWPEGVQHGGPWWIEIRPNPDASADELAGGLASTVLRQVDFRAMAQHRRGALTGLNTDATKQLATLTERLSSTLRAAVSHGLSDEYFALLAYVYTQLVNLGLEPVVDNLAEMAGKRPQTIKSHLWQARKRGMLSGHPGRVGGELTEQAERLLENMNGAQ